MRYRIPEKGINLYPEDWEVEVLRPKTPQDLPSCIKGVLYPPLCDDDEPTYACWYNLRKQSDTAPKPLHPPADAVMERMFGEISPADFQPKNDDMASFYTSLYTKEETVGDVEKPKKKRRSVKDDKG